MINDNNNKRKCESCGGGISGQTAVLMIKTWLLHFCYGHLVLCTVYSIFMCTVHDVHDVHDVGPKLWGKMYHSLGLPCELR